MDLLTELDAFFTDHQDSGDLDAGVEGQIMWIACECGARMARRVDERDALPSTIDLPYRSGMDRRRFLLTSLAGALAAPLAAEAQQLGKVYRIGFLKYSDCSDPGSTILRQGLRELGYVEGRNIVIECRAAPGKTEQLPELATELALIRK
jgi:hypothetical protein